MLFLLARSFEEVKFESHFVLTMQIKKVIIAYRVHPILYSEYFNIECLPYVTQIKTITICLRYLYDKISEYNT